MLDSVFDLLGSPTELDLSFITDENALIYMKKFKQRPPANLEQYFHGVSPEGVHLLRQMLQINPYLRPTIEQVIASPYFEKVRSFSDDREAKH